MFVERPISRTPCLLAIAAVCFVFCGCVKVDQTLTLNPDGSGTIHLSYARSEESSSTMQDVARAMMEEAGPEMETPLDFTDEELRQDFKEYEPYGVFLDSLKSEQRDGWKYRHMVIRFRDLKGLSQTGFLSDRNISLVRNAQGNYVFTQTANANGGIPEEFSGGDPQSEYMLAELMQGFRAVIRVRTPGRILETNAPEKTDNSATWTFDLEKDPQALQKVQKTAPRIVFEGKGLKIPDFRTMAVPGR